MFKTIITFAALAALAGTAIAPAHALVVVNGGGENGTGDNGTGDNGVWPNGGGSNGEWPNGGGNNGEFPNGGGTNGAESSSSTLSIQAIELPPKTR
jgi:hypothetical protein